MAEIRPDEAPEVFPAAASELRALLEAHLKAMPALPVPYDPHSPAGRAYYQARAAWSDRRRRLEHEIWKAETPQRQFKRPRWGQADPGHLHP